jgi:cytochrome c2
MLALATLVVGCGLSADHEAAALTGGDPSHGPTAMRRYGCVSCHTIPGVRGANATVGPSLAGVARRSYLAGVLPNTPENLVRWIRDPQAIDSLTAMPNTGVNAVDARDIAGYLYTLR